MPNNRDFGSNADLFAHEHFVQLVDAADRFRVERDDHIAFAQAGLFGRAVFFHRNDKHASLERQIIKAHHPTVDRHVLAGHANVATANFSFFN